MLETVDFLKSVSVDARSKLCDVVKLKDCEQGETVVTQGDMGNEMFIVKTGELEALVDGAVVLKYNQGMYFGELALLPGSSGHRKATVKAVTKCVLLTIDRASFKRLLGNAEQLLEQKAAAIYKPA
jgi:cAMP-dependent protein kinase regulator